MIRGRRYPSTLLMGQICGLCHNRILEKLAPERIDVTIQVQFAEDRLDHLPFTGVRFTDLSGRIIHECGTLWLPTNWVLA